MAEETITPPKEELILTDNFADLIPGNEGYKEPISTPVDIPTDNFADLIPKEIEFDDGFFNNILNIKDGYIYIGDSDVEQDYEIVDPSSYDQVDEFFTNLFGVDFKRQKQSLPEEDAVVAKGLELFGLDRDIASIPGVIIGADVVRKIGDKALKAYGGKIRPILQVVNTSLGAILGGTGAKQAYDFLQDKITGEEKTVEEIWAKLPQDLQTEANYEALALGFGTIPYLVKRGLVKVGPTAKEIYEKAKNLGIDTYLADFADSGIGRSFLQTAGVFPFASSNLKATIRGRANKLNQILDDFFYSYAPIGSSTNASTLGAKLIETAKNQYKRWRYFNAKQWKSFEDLAMGKGTVVKFDNNIVPVKNIKLKEGSDQVPFILDKAKEIIENAGGMNIKPSSPNYTEAYKAAKIFYNEYAYKNFIPVVEVRKFITKTLKNAQKRSYSSEGGASVGDIVALKKSAEDSIENINLSNVPKDIADAIKKKYEFAKKTFNFGFNSNGVFFEGKPLYERAMAKTVAQGQKNLFDIKLTEEGTRYYSEIVKDVLQFGSKESVDDLYKLIGKDDELFGTFIRKFLDDAYEGTVKVKGSKGGADVDKSFNFLNFDPGQFRKNLGLPSFESYLKGGSKSAKQEGFEQALKLFSDSPQGKNIDPKKFVDLVYLMEKHGSVYVPDASTFLRRASMFGGLSTLMGLHFLGYGDVGKTGSQFGIGTILTFRGITKILANPKNTKFLFEALDSRIPYYRSYNSALKLLDITLDHLTEESGKVVGEQRQNILDYMDLVGTIKKSAIDNMPEKDAERPIDQPLEIEEALDEDEQAQKDASLRIPNPIPSRGVGFENVVPSLNIPLEKESLGTLLTVLGLFIPSYLSFT